MVELCFPQSNCAGGAAPYAGMQLGTGTSTTQPRLAELAWGFVPRGC